MEYATRGSLMEYNDRTGMFSINHYYREQGLSDYNEEHIRGFISDIASGLEYCNN
jgi:hypothetical protein